jgi:RNA polymerase sigma factor (sigma-70 family)
MRDGQKLLAEYVQRGSEPAFRELVNRYLDLVYSAALRLVNGDPHLAEDVAQKVFVDLARMAGSLSKQVMLGSWLHRHTCFVARNAVRGERRRQNRERQAAEMSALNSTADVFQDYSLEFVQNGEEAYLAAGYSSAEAKTPASMELLLPQLAELKQLDRQIVDLAASYRQAGDDASARIALLMGANLGQRYNQPNGSPGEALVSQLVGIAIERIALNAMDPAAPYGSDGSTVKDRLDQLAQQDAQLRSRSQQVSAMLPTMSDQDWISYKDRWRSFGEAAAEHWLISKYGRN